ncbi:unnamed protein product [Bursaphelenchus xylophilus]|uniref:Small ribosomal subunit protein mS39 n=1 Tax=Bursaphelenchus xylophilus TaxID=6326 RepID=A0A1I7RHX0_BURXY|nr:unnamed protein product [Bursaphelenchus xylophilus]CAG9115313.1 unnamed protein product [Bursaphelenchus xylophilus]
MSGKAATSVASVPFIIPKQIKRSKTAVLKALASTVGTDTTAPHFQFIDDPLTIPSSNFTKRNYFLAKEFGKRAARHLAKEWPTLFMFDRDEPRLPVFRPENLPALVESEAPSEDLLIRLLDGREVHGALQVYEKIRAGKIDVSKDTLDRLFKQAAYYNGQNPPVSEEVEWHGIRNYFEDFEGKWERNGPIELLFQTVEQNAENYSILIAAKAKYGDTAALLEAYKHLDDMIGKKLIPEEFAFNCLLRVEQNPKKAFELLSKMAKLNVKPSIRTFNAFIMAQNKNVDFANKWGNVKKALAEVNRLRLVPSLTTFDLVLGGLRSQKVQGSETPPVQGTQELVLAITALSEIMDILESRPQIDPHDHTDQNFFVTAMSVATAANNAEMVDRVEALYRSDKNNVKMTAFTVEAVFYNRYLNYKIFTQLTDINEIGEIYISLVPRLVGVSRMVIKNVLNKFPAENPPWALLKRVIEDGISGRQITDTDLCRSFLRHLLKVNVDSLDIRESEQFRNLIVKLNDIWLEFANFTDENLKNRQIKLRPSMATQTAILLLKVGEHEKAFSLINLLTSADSDVLNLEDKPSLDYLLALFDAVIETNSLNQASNVLEIIARHYKEGPLEQLAEKITKKFVLNSTQKRVITNFVKLRNL